MSDLNYRELGQEEKIQDGDEFYDRNLCAWFPVQDFLHGWPAAKCTDKIQRPINPPSQLTEGEKCFFCNEPIEPFAGNPGRWPLHFCFGDNSGKVKAFHVECVTERLSQLSDLKAEKAELQKEVERLNAVRQELMDNLDHWRNAYRCISDERRDIREQLEHEREVQREILAEKKIAVDCGIQLAEERDSLRARVAVLESSANTLLGVLAHHEVETIDCDRRGNKYCDCLQRAIDQSSAALKGGG